MAYKITIDPGHGGRDPGAVFEGRRESDDNLDLALAVGELLEENCFFIENIDATIIAQAPKMRPHIDQMRVNIAQALGIDVEQVNVKATTEEGLGFTGTGEGISSQAICLLTTPKNMVTMDVTDEDGQSKCSGCQGCQKQ